MMYTNFKSNLDLDPVFRLIPCPDLILMKKKTSSKTGCMWTPVRFLLI